MRLASILLGASCLFPELTGAQSPATAEPLDRYVACQYADSLYPVKIIRLPGRGLRYRTVATTKGERRVSVIDGYTILLGQGAPSYFANMKVEISDPKQYPSDKEAVTANIELAMDQSKGGEWEHMPFNGFDLYGLSFSSMDGNGPNGMYVLFNDSTRTIVTIYFLGQPAVYRTFKTIEQHDAIRDRMLVALTSCAANPAAVQAAQAVPRLATPDDVDAFMNDYYLRPRPELIDEVIRALEPSHVLTLERAVGPVTAFFSEVFTANPARIPEWEHVISSQPEVTRRALNRAMTWSKGGGVGQFEERSAETNDLYWGAFFASGNPLYVKKLLALVPLADNLDDARLWATGATAKWSLASNAQQHPAVRSILEAEKATADKRMQDIIAELLTGDPARFQLEMLQTAAKQRAAGKWK